MVWSRPMAQFSPGNQCVPRWRKMMFPGMTYCSVIFPKRKGLDNCAGQRLAKLRYAGAGERGLQMGRFEEIFRRTPGFLGS